MYRPVVATAVWLGFVVVSATLPAVAAGAEGLRAGAAKIDITPSEPVNMAGYESRKDLSSGVHDPISARALAFELGGQRLVLVSTEVLGFYDGTAQAMRSAILEACKLQPSELFLCAIHTHSAPTVTLNAQKAHPNNLAYTKGLQGKLVEVVRAALAGLATAQVSFGLGASPIGGNRREVVQDESGKTKIVLGRNPSVMTDREVQVVRVTRGEGNEVAAVLFAYSTHSTSLGPHNYLISGDVHGLAAQFLEKYLGGHVVAPEFAGASGDIDPWYRVLPEFKTTNGWVPEPILMGTLLGEEVAHVVERTNRLTTVSGIKTEFRTVDLPGKVPGESQAEASSPTSFNITVGSLGDIAFVGLGGEVFTEIGQTIKAASPFRHTIILTHCNGAAGYVPTRASYPQGGYEVQASHLAPGGGEQIAEVAGKMLKELKD
jgi:hypothetical protein